MGFFNRLLVDTSDRLGFLCDEFAKVFGIDIQRFGLNICENGFRSDLEQGDIRGRAGNDRSDHFVSGGDSGEQIGQVQGVSF